MLKAVIFDFDGVIADDERLHLEGFRLALASHGISLVEADYFARYVGLDDHDGFVAMLQADGRSSDEAMVAELMERKKQAFKGLIEDRVNIFPGVRELLGDLRGSRPLPCAIGSGALRSEIELILSMAGLRSMFDVIVSAEDVSRGKPDPETFSLARRKLAAAAGPLEPAECLVIEDSVQGLQAAVRAGMKTLAVTNTHPRDMLRADCVVGSLEEVDRRRLSLIFDDGNGV